MRTASGGGVGPQVNKFEQVSSNDHHISLAGGWECPYEVGIPGPVSVSGGGGYGGSVDLLCHVTYLM